MTIITLENIKVFLFVAHASTTDKPCWQSQVVIALSRWVQMPRLYTAHKLNFPQPNPASLTCILKPCLHLISQSCHKVLSNFFTLPNSHRGNECIKWKYFTHIMIFKTENIPDDPTILYEQPITRITSWHRKITGSWQKQLECILWWETWPVKQSLHQYLHLRCKVLSLCLSLYAFFLPKILEFGDLQRQIALLAGGQQYLTEHVKWLFCPRSVSQ